MCRRKITPQAQALRSGVVDMILAIIGISAAVADVSILNQHAPTVDTRNQHATSLALLYILIVLSAIRLLMGFILTRGARSRNEQLVRLWLYCSFVLWTVQIIEFITKLVIGTFVLWSTISNILAIFLRIYVMYIVYKFVVEIESEMDRLPLCV